MGRHREDTVDQRLLVVGSYRDALLGTELAQRTPGEVGEGFESPDQVGRHPALLKGQEPLRTCGFAVKPAQEQRVERARVEQRFIDVEYQMHRDLLVVNGEMDGTSSGQDERLQLECVERMVVGEDECRWTMSRVDG